MLPAGGGAGGNAQLAGRRDSTLNSLLTLPRLGAVWVRSVSGAIRGVIWRATASATGAVTLLGSDSSVIIERDVQAYRNRPRSARLVDGPEAFPIRQKMELRFHLDGVFSSPFPSGRQGL